MDFSKSHQNVTFLDQDHFAISSDGDVIAFCWGWHCYIITKGRNL